MKNIIQIILLLVGAILVYSSIIYACFLIHYTLGIFATGCVLVIIGKSLK